MQTASPSLPTPSPLFRDTLLSAARFWEPRRILYNLVLTAGVAFWIVSTWPHFRPAFTWSSLFFLVVAALLANICYTSAYLLDLAFQHAGLRTSSALRWSLWTLGTLLALFFETYWIADEVYPFV